MKIIKAWATYNGVYLREEEALLKKNRKRDFDTEAYCRDGSKHHEVPRVVWLLEADDGRRFLLNETPVVL